jgi:hypothetical protein
LQLADSLLKIAFRIFLNILITDDTIVVPDPVVAAIGGVWSCLIGGMLLCEHGRDSNRNDRAGSANEHLLSELLFLLI